MLIEAASIVDWAKTVAVCEHRNLEIDRLTNTIYDTTEALACKQESLDDFVA